LARLTFLGVGDAVHPSGGTTSLLYRGSQTWLMDCGPAIASLVFRSLRHPNELDAIWVSHQHADHCFGIPTLLLMLRLARRTKPLDLLSGPGMASILRDLLETGYPGAFRPSKCFAIRFKEVRPEQPLALSGLKLSSARTQHTVACHALRIEDRGHSFCFSGDGKVSNASLDLYRSADLVVHECQFAETANTNHCHLADLEPLVTAANVRQLALVHCNSHERAAIVERSRGLFGTRVFVPEAGDTFQLGTG
jgi:ribonuclease Z